MKFEDRKRMEDAELSMEQKEEVDFICVNMFFQ